MRVVAVLLLCLLAACAVPTCEEEERQLRTLLPETQIDLEGIPSEVAADIVRGVVLVKSQYPYALHRLGHIAEEQRFDLLYAVTYMRTLYPTNSIIFNGRKMISTRSVENQYEWDVWRGHHVGTALPAATAITVHELGHCLCANLRLQDNEAVIRLYQKYKAETDNRAGLFQNARANIAEFISEFFVDIVCNGRNMSKTAWRLKIILDQL